MQIQDQKYLTISVASKFNVTDVTTPISTNRRFLNEINVSFMSLEDKSNRKISALAACLIAYYSI